MKFLRLCAAIGCMVISSMVLRAQTPESASLPLPEDYFPALKVMIENALRLSPKMVTQNVDLFNAEQDRIVARAGQLPSIGGYMSYYPYDRQTRADLVGSSNVKKVAYSVSVTQPIFHWGVLRNATKIATIQVKIAQGDYAQAYLRLADEIRSQYLQLIINKTGLQRARYNLKLTNERLALGKTKLEKHIIAESDLFGPTIDAEQAQLWADRVEENYRDSCRMLAKLAGVQEINETDIPDEIPPVAGAVAEVQSRLQRFASQSEPDTAALRKMRLQLEIERLNYASSKVRLRPKVSAVFGVSQDQQNYSLASNYKYQVQDRFAGISVGWTIFDGLANGAYKAKTLSRKRELERTYQDRTAETIIAAKGQAREVEFAARGLVIEEKLLGSAVNAVKVRREDVARGTATESDLAGAQLSLYDSQVRAFGARRDYLMRIATFLSTIDEDPVLAKIPAQRK